MIHQVQQRKTMKYDTSDAMQSEAMDKETHVSAVDRGYIADLWNVALGKVQVRWRCTKFVVSVEPRLKCYWLLWRPIPGVRPGNTRGRYIEAQVAPLSLTIRVVNSTVNLLSRCRCLFTYHCESGMGTDQSLLTIYRCDKFHCFS